MGKRGPKPKEVIEGKKQCSCCKEMKVLEDFHVLKSHYTGRQGTCKKCQLVRLTNYRKKTKCKYWKREEGDTYTVYTFTNPANEVYVGHCGTDPHLRALRHKAGWNSGRNTIPKLFSSFNKYGYEAHEHEVLMTLETKQQARKAEAAFIAFYQKLGLSLNINKK